MSKLESLNYNSMSFSITTDPTTIPLSVFKSCVEWAFKHHPFPWELVPPDIYFKCIEAKLVQQLDDQFTDAFAVYLDLFEYSEELLDDIDDYIEREGIKDSPYLSSITYYTTQRAPFEFCQTQETEILD
jgi:hypothetical protein